MQANPVLLLVFIDNRHGVAIGHAPIHDDCRIDLAEHFVDIGSARSDSGFPGDHCRVPGRRKPTMARAPDCTKLGPSALDHEDRALCVLECGVANVCVESFLVVRAAETDDNQLNRPGEVRQIVTERVVHRCGVHVHVGIALGPPG